MPKIIGWFHPGRMPSIIQYNILRALSEKDGLQYHNAPPFGNMVNEFIEVLGRDPSMSVHHGHLEKMEKRGWITSTNHHHHITDNGRKVLEALNLIFDL